MNSSREIRLAFLVALTLTVSGASAVLSIAEGAIFPVGLTPVFAVAAVWMNEWKRWLILPTIAANALGVVAILAAGAELTLGTVEARILSGAHLSAYIAWIILFMRKQYRQYWWLVAISVLQLAVSSALTREPHLGLSLVGMMFLIVWTLTLFTLLRLRNRTESVDVIVTQAAGRSVDIPIVVRHGIQSDTGVRWIGLRLRFTVLGMCLASLVMSGIVFAAFPRVFIGTPGFLHDISMENSGIVQRTGFRDQVQLGELGPILKSDERVLQVSAVDQGTGRAMTMIEVADRLSMDEVLFRGNSMGRYSAGAWNLGLGANRDASESSRRYLSENASPVDCIRVNITQDAPIGTFAFVPTPVVGARLLNSQGRLMKRRLSESVVFDFRTNGARPDENPDSISFEVYCEPPASHWQHRPPIEIVGAMRQWLYPNVRSPRPQDQSQTLWVTQDLKEIAPRTWVMAQRLCHDDGRRASTAECVRRVVYLLRDSGDYEYSLEMTRADATLDPVDDFLVNHKTGHCQYFASAAVLILQSVGIPTRIVNGFKGTYDDPESGIAEVRQKHAHVWVEYRDNDRWYTMDPTPASRNDLLAIKTQQGVLGNIQKAVSELWKSGIDNVTPERQRAAIQPVVAAWNSATAEIRRLGLIGAIHLFFRGVLSNPSAWISWQGLVGTFVCLLPVALLLRNRPWRWMRLLFRWLRNRLSPQRRTTTHIVRFYKNFRKACARSGLEFPVSHTAHENARSAEQYFQHQLTPDIDGIPVRIAQAFNAVRYGDQLLTPEQTDRLGHEVALLTSAISTARDGRKK